MIASNFRENELEQLGIEDIMKEFTNVMDGLLDGGVLNIRITDNDYMAPDEKKPVIPVGIQYDLEKSTLENSKEFFYISSLLIVLLAQLNPRGSIRQDLYYFKISIIYNALVSGAACGEKNNNFKFSDVVFDSKYIEENKRKLTKEELILVREVIRYQKAAFNFLAFSVLNFIRFNHHYMREKLNLIQKGLMGLSENQINDILDVKNRFKNLDFFYENFVSCAKLLDDMKFYYMYINPKLEYLPKKDKSFNYYNIIGIVNVSFKDDIIKIRKDCTSNGFLILDITKAIIDDIIAKKLAFLLPNANVFQTLMEYRKTIREHPFLYHPSNLHFNLGTDKLDELKEKFNASMSLVAGFIFCYSELMYSSVKEAKCRNKYSNKISKDDEVLAKTIFELSSSKATINEELKEKVKIDLHMNSIKIDNETNLNKLNEEVIQLFKGL